MYKNKSPKNPRDGRKVVVFDRKCPEGRILQGQEGEIGVIVIHIKIVNVVVLCGPQ